MAIRIISLKKKKIIKPGDWGTYVLAPTYGIILRILAFQTIYGVNSMTGLVCKIIDTGQIIRQIWQFFWLILIFNHPIISFTSPIIRMAQKHISS